MKRKISEKLIEWKEKTNRKPLMVRGARQVGKTYSIAEFGKSHFSGNFHLINFEKNPELHDIFELNLDSRRIISELELIINERIIPGEDLLFFDEIQECPKAVASLRYFYEGIPELHIISAGSLLEFALGDISFPVGRLQMLQMYPMNFEEFLVANEKGMLSEKIMQPDVKLSESIIKLINRELHRYFIIGGMPECVKTYVQSGSVLEVANIQTDLLETYRQDFSKYVGHSDKRCLNSVLTSVAKNTGNQIKYSKLDDNFSNPTIRKAFELLETARLFTKVRATSPDGIPIGIHASEKKFKTVFIDIGLFSNISGYFSDKSINKNNFASAFNGKMAEQFVGQELISNHGRQLHYWSRNKRGSNAETDYLIEKKGEIIPIEVKSGKSGSLKSLHLLLDSFPGINSSFVFTEDKIGDIKNQRIKFLPLFMVGSI